ncbi:hypothetical protein SAMN02745751_01613 [Dethiosulfatibacter aminovorans DSM 17477]|uniref:Uncharacterized protein n=1 Tax=Dethiosulfatibacter aminovorans DSM 17477 TaxID=1121476 RepID=A0A1M6G0F3_9FIRM|nr:hypothetical protein [Dethiosulfatibacter aminovorans]SHJ03485.1 hypothetical protein SAMN02745751_01613 [Dethiosulfatibacter aminovorans DSM 17477]
MDLVEKYDFLMNKCINNGKSNLTREIKIESLLEYKATVENMCSEEINKHYRKIGENLLKGKEQYVVSDKGELEEKNTYIEVLKKINKELSDLMK